MQKNNFSAIMSVRYIRNNIEIIPKYGGVYKHYVDEEGLKYLDGVNPTQKEILDDGAIIYLLYIGLSDNLLSRFKWHLGITNSSHSNIMNGTLSTLRLSYMANHININSLSQQDELNKFMDKHIYIQYMETENFEAVEKDLISSNDVPLNIKGNTHSFTTINTDRRIKIRNEYYSRYPEYKKDIKRNSSSSVKITDIELGKYVEEAKKDGIKNKSKFLRWFRDVKKLSASQSKLYKAWETK